VLVVALGTRHLLPANVKGMAKKPDIKQIDRIVREEGLTIGQREILHEEITKQESTLAEIMNNNLPDELSRLLPTLKGLEC
jgi:hypothetical protein